MPTIETSITWHELDKQKILSKHVPHISSASHQWNEVIADKTLLKLIAQTLRANNELKIAEARIVEARSNEQRNAASLLPRIDAEASHTRGEVGSFGGANIDHSTRYGLNGQWNLDLFGRTRRLLEAAEYDTEAQQAAMQQLKLLLAGEVIRNYTQLRQFQKQYTLTQQNITIQQESFNATQAMREEGMATELEVLRAHAQIENTEALLPQLNTQISQAIYRLATLSDKHQDAQFYQALETHFVLPVIQNDNIVSLPLNTLNRRPDVREAERQLASATALSAAAFAQFFPDVSLNGFIGRSKSDLFGTLSPWTATASALLPLLNFGAIEAEVDAAEAREQQAYYNFRQVVAAAVEDVEVSYARFFNETKRLQNLRVATTKQQSALNVAQEQFYGGIISQLDLLEAQRGALQAEIEETESEAQSIINTASLFIALGSPNESQKTNGLVPTDMEATETTIIPAKAAKRLHNTRQRYLKPNLTGRSSKRGRHRTISVSQYK